MTTRCTRADTRDGAENNQRGKFVTDHITQRIRDALSNSDASDPSAVSQQLLAASTAAERKEWLAVVLPRYVADVMRNERNSALNQTATTSRRMPSKSAKVAGVRDWWTKFIESRIAVGGEWMAVGELTAEDLLIVVAERREQAARINTQADRYDALIGLLHHHGVTTVAELPSDVVLATGLAAAA